MRDRVSVCFHLFDLGGMFKRGHDTLPRDETILTFGAETANSFNISGDRLAITFFVCAGKTQQKIKTESMRHRIGDSSG